MRSGEGLPVQEYYTILITTKIIRWYNKYIPEGGCPPVDWSVRGLDLFHCYSRGFFKVLYIYLELEENKIKIPSEMTQNLMILHSYILVKVNTLCK